MHFYKFEATGNDFILLFDEKIHSQQAKRMCADHYGIGADGVIHINHKNQVTIYNKDGSEAAMCGNGLRCLCALLTRKNKVKEHLVFLQDAPIQLVMENEEMARVWFESPKQLEKDDEYFIQCRNNHYLFLVDDLDSFTFNPSQIALSEKKHCNLHAIQIISENCIQIKSYEFGVGHTNSCGSGSIAAFYLLHKQKKVKDTITIKTEGGDLTAIYHQQQFYLMGPVHFIFEGEIEDGF